MNSQVADLVGDRDGGRASTPRSHPYPFPLPRITTAAKKPLTVEEADSFTSSEAGIQRPKTRHSPLDSRLRGNDRGEKGNSLAKCDCPVIEGAGIKKSSLVAQQGQQFLQRRTVEFFDGFGKPIGEFGGEWVEAGGVDDDAGMREFGQAAQFVHIVPGEIEIGGDLLHEAAAGPPAMAMLQGREIGCRYAQCCGHVLEALAPAAP